LVSIFLCSVEVSKIRAERFVTKLKRGTFFFMYYGQHFFICRPSDSTVSEDAGIEPRTVVTTALAVRRFKNSAKSHPHSAKSHPQAAKSHPHSAKSHPQRILRIGERPRAGEWRWINVLYECDRMYVCHNMKNKQKDWHPATKLKKKYQCAICWGMPRKTYRAGGEGENEEDDPDPEAEVDVEREDVGGVGAVEARAQPQQPVDDEQQQQQARLTGGAAGSTTTASRVRFHSWNTENG
jgi:hypothetical protein